MITIIGWIVCPILGVVIGWIVTSLRKNNTETKALKLGMQAILRNELIKSYKDHAKAGYVEFEDRDNWENMYQQYHNLGANGVMDDTRQKFLNLPDHK